jgi:hypothetical protein
MDYQKQLSDLEPEHEFFIGIDSDGCVFDSMEVKQKEFFIPSALKYFNLFAISKTLRETWEFINLYSVYRGGNRFPSMIKVFDLLSKREEIKESGIELPDMTALKKWVSFETKLGNATLRKYYEETNEQSLKTVLEWTEALNNEISIWLHSIPPFHNAIKALEEVHKFSDIMVISQTPLEALEREWLENNIKKYVRLIAAQEHGTKTEHVFLAAKEKYPDDKIILIGDAFGDMVAAKNNGVLFYPIIPGNEERSWKRFIEEAVVKFRNGSYAGNYQKSLLGEFKNSLPDTPPWEK